MSSEIENYQAARAAYDAAEQRCQRLSDIVQNGSRALLTWHKAIVSNATGGFPMELVMGRQTPSIDAHQWPTGQQIATVLSEYHQAKSAMNNAYSSIPQAQREVIVPPPK